MHPLRRVILTILVSNKVLRLAHIVFIMMTATFVYDVVLSDYLQFSDCDLKELLEEKEAEKEGEEKEKEKEEFEDKEFLNEEFTLAHKTERILRIAKESEWSTTYFAPGVITPPPEQA